MLALALRIIAHRPLRYLVALLGISVAAGLAFIQLGLYFGFKENASVIVDNTKGDLWVCAEFQNNFDFPNPISRRHLDQVRAVPGVKSAHPLVVVFAHWRLPGGADQTVEMIGFDTITGVGKPWNMIAGSFANDLSQRGYVSVDTSTLRKLGYPGKGSPGEINGIKVKVGAITEGIRSFQGKPIVFADINTIRSVSNNLGSNELHYIIVKLMPGADIEDVKNQILGVQHEVKTAKQESGKDGGVYQDHLEVYTQKEFSLKAQDYWLNSTGAGKALGVAALLGLIVGIVVAGQVLYTSTLEHIREYGTLKAIGASNLQVSITIMAQAVAWALPAHVIAGGLLYIAMKNIGGIGIQIAIDAETYAFLGFCTVGVCILASLLSVLRVMRVEPADVFR